MTNRGHQANTGCAQNPGQHYCMHPGTQRLGHSNTPTEALTRRIAMVGKAIETLQAAVAEMTAALCKPGSATWLDVTNTAHIADNLKRGDLVGDEE